MLITDIVPCQDGHAQERSLLDSILAKVRARDLWVADRNFCVRHFLLGIAARGGFFIIRLPVSKADLPKVIQQMKSESRVVELAAEKH